MSDRLLVLVRHGQSDWNLKNLFTGWKDPDLTEQGIAEAKDAGRKLKAQGLKFDIAFTSVLLRAQHTLDLILDGGPARGGPASTVVDTTFDPVRILRAGAISPDRIERCLTSADLPGVGR